MTSQNNTDVRQSLSSQTIADLSSPRLSGVRYPYYGVNDYYPAATQQAVDDIINKYVRKGDQSPTKTTDPLRQSNYSPAAKALINAENTVNALRQSGVNPVVATDKAISETDLPVKYNLLPQGHLAGAWDRSQWWGPEAWRYGGYWPGYYPGWRGVDGTVVAPTTTTTTAPTVVVEKVSTPAPEVNLRASVVEASKTLSADEFYKKYGFYPSNWEGRYDLSGYYGRNWDGRYDPLWSSYGYNGLYGGAYGGRLVDGKWTDSRFEGKWVDGKWVEGKNVDGKWVDGKFPIVDAGLYGSRWWEGRNWDGKYDPLWANYGYSGLYGGSWGGRLVDGKWTDSRFEGKWVDGKWVEGKNVDGKWVDGKFPVVDSGLYGSRWWEGRNWDGRNWDGKYDPLWANYGYNGLYGGAYGGRLVDGKWTDSRFEGKWVDGKWVEGKNVDGKWVDGKFPIVDSSLYGSRWWDSRYGYPYGTTSTTYPYGSVYPYSRVSVTPVDPLLVSTSKSDKTGYVRQYTQPKTEEAQPTTVQTTDAQSQNASRKASQQVDEERFDFENNRN